MASRKIEPKEDTAEDLSNILLLLRSVKHSIKIDRLSSTTYIKDCSKEAKEIAETFGIENVWRASIGKYSKWHYGYSMTTCVSKALEEYFNKSPEARG